MDNLLKHYAGTSYRYDERGNMTERVRNGWRTVFAWDGFNRMTAATDHSGITTTFSYDALGRRLSKSSGDTTTLFGWDGDVLAFESTQSNSAIEEGGDHGWSVHYIHEPNSFVPLMQVRRASAMALSETTDAKALMEANGGAYDIEQDPLWNGEQRQVPRAFDRREMAFYQCDHLGTPQELTDHEGSIAWSAQYKAWGEAREAISEAGRRAGFRNPIRFQGQYWDEETGLHYNRYRYYDPQVGRFISSDPIKLLGGLNVFAYAKNSTAFIDPLGLATAAPPTITASEITDKTRSEIRVLAASKGLVATGQPDSAGLPRKWKCPCTGNQRLRLDRGHIDQQTGLPYNDPKAAVDHVHGYQPDGLTKIVSPVDGNSHFPTKGP
ncbi:RHS repeat-associated protein [Variovorax sp. 1140]|uniref:RHS repeat-associated core domain-containing protein n=1 Tax=Variovorax atrisoli TaxID=3394203 RepID=UPI003395674C